MLAFFMGLLCCALVLRCAEVLINDAEANRRVQVARIRGTNVPKWPEGY